MSFRSTLLGMAVAGALVALGWYTLGPAPPVEESTAPAPVGVQAPAVAAAPPVAPTAPPAAPATRPPRTGPPPKPVLASVFNDYLRAKEYRAIYDRLRNSAEGETAEGRLVLWEILRNCATVTEGRRAVYRQSVPKREDFLAGLAPGDPQREQRIAAFDDFTTNRCAGFEGVAITQADLDRMLADAAAAGDPRARALALEQDLWLQRRAQGRNQVALSDASIDALKQIISTRDPEAIRVAGRVFANTWADTTLRVGASQQPVEQRAFMNAWLVLACEYGQPCGPDTPRMQQACAIQGHCNAQSYADHLYYYGSTPHDSQMLAQYQALLRTAIETGDWSQLTVVRGLPIPSNRVNFVPGPR